MSEEKKLPKGWVETALNAVAAINPTLDISTAENSTLVSFIPMSAVEAETGCMNTSTLRRFDEVKRGYTAFRENDILFAKITPCMENGKIAIARSLASGIGFGSTEFHVLRPEKGIESRLLYYYLSQISFRQSARMAMTGSAGQLRVPATFLTNASFRLPPTVEQQRIVAALERHFTRLDAVIAILQKNKAKLKRARASVLKAAVEGKLTEAWRAEHPAAESASELLQRILAERRKKWEAEQLAKMEERGVVPKDDKWKEAYKEPLLPSMEKLPKLPEGWCWASLEQCSRRITDGTHEPPPFTDEGIPFIFVTHIVNGTISFENTKHISESTYRRLQARCPVEPGDILYTAVGSYGVAVPVLTKYPFSFQRHIAHIKPSVSLSMDYLTTCLNSPICRNQAHEVARGVAQKTVTLTDLARFAIPLPPLSEQQQIIAEVERRFSIINQLEAAVEASLKRIERFRQSILKKAFAGRLVPQDPNDEPASFLLDRIREERKRREQEDQQRRKEERMKNSQNPGSVRAKKMGKQCTPLVQVLVEAKKPLPPDDLFRRAGLQQDVIEDVEVFFEETREAEGRQIKVTRPDTTQVFLEAVSE